jgi:hypothetical protein
MEPGGDPVTDLGQHASIARRMSLHRRVARKILPLPVRLAFVRAADARQPPGGRHHKGQPAITASQTNGTAAGAVQKTGEF